MRGEITVTEEMFRRVPDVYNREVKSVAGRWVQSFAYKFENGLHHWLFDESYNHSMKYLKALKDDGWDVYQLRAWNF